MQFSEIVGQDKLKEVLIDSVKHNRVSHAQLFVEQQGAGGLALAIAYAQYLCCENPTDTDSCNECPSCKKIKKLEHPDLHFVFPVNTTTKITRDPISKSFLPEWRNEVLTNPYQNLYDWLKSLGIENKQGNINVKESADILKTLSLKSFEAPYKIMIIWMVEQMHPSASNKLLKVLEEPPEKTLFILITKDQEAIISTILSRTQLLRLERLTDDEIAKGLVQKHAIDEGLAASYAQLAEGDFGKAIELTLQEHNDEQMMQDFRNWMLLCFKKDVVGISFWAEQMSKSGRVNQINFLKFGTSMFRKALMQNFAAAEIAPLLAHEQSFIPKFSKFVHAGNCIQLIEEFNLGVQNIERNANAKILFMDMSLKVLMLMLVKPK